MLVSKQESGYWNIYLSNRMMIIEEEELKELVVVAETHFISPRSQELTKDNEILKEQVKELETRLMELVVGVTNAMGDELSLAVGQIRRDNHG